ncbi:hypothetical protein ONK29_25990, partial [Salmonella enterica subsp. enterica serovar Anatum]|nr:hypothetical protein [Salmonella enterica subsp. enterica serovar Anatum]
VYLVDEQGEVAHQWQLPVRAGRDAVLLPNGNLGYNGSHRTSAPPIDVILIILSVVLAAASLQASGGLDLLVKLAEKILRRHPRY